MRWSSPSFTALALPLPERADVLRWVRRKWYCTVGLFPRAMKVCAAQTAISDVLVKNREAESNSSSVNWLSIPDMILIAWSRISAEDTDADKGWEDSIEELRVEGGGIEVVGANAEGAAAVTVDASRVLSITSAMQLKVDFRAFEMITGFRLLVVLFDAHLELGGCIPLANLASCLRFQSWLLPASLPVVIECTEPIEMSCYWVGWGTVGGRDEDGGGFVRLEEEDTIVLESGGGKDDRGCWKGTDIRWNERSSHGWIKWRINLILCTVLLCVDKIEYLCCQPGGWAGRIEGMCSSRLGTRHKGLHSAIMWPWFRCVGFEWSMLCILSARQSSR